MVGTRDTRNGTHAWEERPSLSDREVYATSARLKQSQTSVKRFANFDVDIRKRFIIRCGWKFLFSSGV